MVTDNKVYDYGTLCHCNRCGYEWHSRVNYRPPTCASCNSPYWFTAQHRKSPPTKKARGNGDAINTLEKELAKRVTPEKYSGLKPAPKKDIK